jgi:hypothetical protein
MPQIVTTGEISFLTIGCSAIPASAGDTSVVAPHSTAASEDYLNNSLHRPNKQAPEVAHAAN